MSSEDDPYDVLLGRIRDHQPGGSEARHAQAELQVQLVRDQIASSERIAKATESTASKLGTATWVLSVATAVLALATVVLVIVTATG